MIGFNKRKSLKIEGFSEFRPLLVSRLDFEEVIKHLLCMIRRFNFMIDFHQDPVRINKEAFSFFDALIFSGHHYFGISQQVYGESIFVPEFLVARYTVLAHSKNNSTHFLKLLKAFAESPSFNRSTRGVVFGIKEQ